MWKSLKQFLSLFQHNPTLNLEHLTVHVLLHFWQREQFPSIADQCTTLSNWMYATGDGTTEFLSTDVFVEMLCLDWATVLLGSLPARVSAEAIFVSKILRLICNFSETSFCWQCDREAKHWLLLHQHNGRWVWGTIFFLWWYWSCKGQSGH